VKSGMQQIGTSCAFQGIRPPPPPRKIELGSMDHLFFGLESFSRSITDGGRPGMLISLRKGRSQMVDDFGMEERIKDGTVEGIA